MPIHATNNSVKREPIPAGNYVARCVSMIHIGTVTENFNGDAKEQNKVRIGWELPTEMKVFKEENGPQPYMISKEYTLSMNEKANLRKMLASWRGKDFTEQEAKRFDITALLGKPCMLNIIHKHGVKDPTAVYEEIGSISPIPKGFTCPEQISKTMVLDYENFDEDVFNSLPDFIKDKMKGSAEYKKLTAPAEVHMANGKGINEEEEDTDLPF